jgi:hypothetical protein
MPDDFIPAQRVGARANRLFGLEAHQAISVAGERGGSTLMRPRDRVADPRVRYTSPISQPTPVALPAVVVLNSFDELRSRVRFHDSRDKRGQFTDIFVRNLQQG